MQTLYLSSFNTLLYAAYHAPRTRMLRAVVLACPPHFEELNKCRRMVNLAARQLGAEGFGVLVPDPAGCGHSGGTLGPNSWQQWVQGVVDAAKWLQATAPQAPLLLWGMRAGALVAAAALAQHGRALKAHGALLWDPPEDGDEVLRHMLRITVAGSFFNRVAGEPSLKVSDLLGALDAGQSVHCIGYAIPAGLANDLRRARLKELEDAMNAAAATSRVWRLEQTVAGAEEPRMPADQTADQTAHNTAHHAKQDTVQRHRYTGPKFWQTAEITMAPELLQLTVACATAAVPPVPSSAAQVTAPVRLECFTPRLPSCVLHDGDVQEQALSFACGSDTLRGVLTLPATQPAAATALLIVVGGPQISVGAHRQFVELARHVAAEGFACLRFDVRGMGDSEGEPRHFASLDDDIDAALTALAQAVPQARQHLLWGLCDGASAALLYAARRAAAAGVPAHRPTLASAVLVNPWVRTEQGQAQTQVKHYYRDRLRSADFWAKLFRGGVSISAVSEAFTAWRRARGGNRSNREDYTQVMAQGLTLLPQPATIILSGRDYTAREFEEHVAAHANWATAMADTRVRVVHHPQADHTHAGAGHMPALLTDTLNALRRVNGQPAAP